MKQKNKFALVDWDNEQIKSADSEKELLAYKKDAISYWSKRSEMLLFRSKGAMVANERINSYSPVKAGQEYMVCMNKLDYVKSLRIVSL